MNGFDLDRIDYGSGAPKDFAYGYARRQDVKAYWDLAREGVLGDATFADHRSQSYAGHLYPIAGASGPIDAADPDWYAADNPEYGSSCADEGLASRSTVVTGATNKSYQDLCATRLGAHNRPWSCALFVADKRRVRLCFHLHVFDGQPVGQRRNARDDDLQRRGERHVTGGLMGYRHLRQQRSPGSKRPEQQRPEVGCERI